MVRITRYARELTAERIAAAITLHGGVKPAALALGIPYSTLRWLADKHGVTVVHRHSVEAVLEKKP